MENIHLLNTASTLKWTKSGPLPVVGDVVLFIATESAGGSKKDGVWRLGRVVTVTDHRLHRWEIRVKSCKTAILLYYV